MPDIPLWEGLLKLPTSGAPWPLSIVWLSPPHRPYVYSDIIILCPDLLPKTAGNANQGNAAKEFELG